MKALSDIIPVRPRTRPSSTILTASAGGLMNSSNFDLIAIGGGLGSSSLAIAMARKGARVLVLEKETQFRDRVRGEYLAPWGVAEAVELGIADLLSSKCAKALPWIEMGFGPRNLVETT